MTHESSTRGRGGASNMQPTSASDIASAGSMAILRITTPLCHDFAENARARRVRRRRFTALVRWAHMDAPDDLTLLTRWRGGDREAGDARVPRPPGSAFPLLATPS